MPLFWLSIAFLGGLLLGAALPPLRLFPAAAAGGLLVAAFFERRMAQGSLRFPWYPSWRELSHLPLAVVLAALCLGVLRYQAADSTGRPLTENDLAWYNGRGEVRLEGVVQEMPVVGDSSISLVVSVDQVTPLAEGQPQGAPLPVRGLAVAYVQLGGDWHYGDRIQLTGLPEEPEIEGAPFYHDALARQGIYTTLGFTQARLVARSQGSWLLSTVYNFRAVADRTIAHLLPQPESGLLAGILLGDDTALPENVSKAFRATGITHIIAVSGFNVAIVSGLFVKLLGRLLRARYAVPLAALAVAGYTLLTGASPSVVRAAVMGGIGMVGPLLGRQQVGVNSLAFTAGVMCLFNPNLPWDLSFQLSFGATLGLVLFADPLQGLFVRVAERWLPPATALRLSGPVGEFFLFTLAAQIFTLPITALSFQQVSLAALLANPLVLPVQPYAMILGGVALLLGLVYLPLGQLAAWLCYPLLTYTIRAAEGLAHFQNSLLNVGALSSPLVVLYFGGLVVMRVGLPVLRAQRAPTEVVSPIRRLLQSAFKPAVILGVTGLLAVVLWRAAFSAPDGRLHLDVLNLTGGPALLVRTPGGQAWLVNGAAESGLLADALGRRLPLFTTRLDGLVVTAKRPAAVLTALDNLDDKYMPAACGMSAQITASKALQRFWQQLYDAGVRCASFEESPLFDLGGGAALRILADGKNGTALWLEHGSFHVLIPGGVPPDEMGEPPAGLSLLVLSPDDLVNMGPAVWASTFQPQSVLFTGGNPPLLEWIALDDYEWVSFQTDGSRYWVEGEKR